MTVRGVADPCTASAVDEPGSTGLSSFSAANAAPAVKSAPTKPATARRPRRRELANGLPAWRRLRNSREFSRVERQGARASGDLVAVTVRPGPGRLGLVVSKKVDNRAAIRNRIKRRLREVFRPEKGRYASRGAGTVDVVITARAAAAFADYATLRAAALLALEQALGRLPRR